jgi:hypothetical protein
MLGLVKRVVSFLCLLRGEQEEDEVECTAIGFSCGQEW